jgi:hypothetical protein
MVQRGGTSHKVKTYNTHTNTMRTCKHKYTHIVWMPCETSDRRFMSFPNNLANPPEAQCRIQQVKDVYQECHVNGSQIALSNTNSTKGMSLVWRVIVNL